nr:reverse transcriptase domain-containing protein [Tanacetum cinerariifolium]
MHKLKQISFAFFRDESFAMIQNKVLPKLKDPGSFLIPCNFSKAFSCNALADLGASINLMPYSLYAKLSLETLKPTKISVRLANRSFQYPIKIAKNMLVEKQLNLGVGTERITFSIYSAMKHSYSNDGICFNIDVNDEIFEEDFDVLLDEGSKILHSIEGTILEERLFAEFDEFMVMTADKNSGSDSDTKGPPFEKITFNIGHKIKTSFKEPPSDLELKPLSDKSKYKQLNLGVGTERITFSIYSAMKHSYSNDGICFNIDVNDEIFEEDFDVLLDEGSKILHSIEGTILEERLFAEFDEFMVMTADKNSGSDSDTKGPPFEKITFNIGHKIKTSFKEPPSDLELKPLSDKSKYVFLKEPSFLPVIISSQLSE